MCMQWCIVCSKFVSAVLVVWVFPTHLLFLFITECPCVFFFFSSLSNSIPQFLCWLDSFCNGFFYPGKSEYWKIGNSTEKKNVEINVCRKLRDQFTYKSSQVLKYAACVQSKYSFQSLCVTGGKLPGGKNPKEQSTRYSF